MVCSSSMTRCSMSRQKASKFTDEARRGAIKRLKSDVEALIDKAYHQAHRVLDLARSAHEVSFSDEAGHEMLRLRISDFARVFLVSVSLEKLSSLFDQPFRPAKAGADTRQGVALGSRTE